MARSTFLRNLRTAAGFLAPNIQSGLNGDDAKLERIVKSSPVWLTPAAVEDYVEEDFADLSNDDKRRLSRFVSDFTSAAAAVPQDQPATKVQVKQALPPFLGILQILTYYLDHDAVRAHQLLDDQTWPDEVVGFSCRAGHDSTGDPCLRVTIVLREDVPQNPDFSKITRELRRKIARVLSENGIDLWPYVRFTSAPEADLLYAATT